MNGVTPTTPIASSVPAPSTSGVPLLLARAHDLALPALAGAFDVALDRFDDALFDRAERAGSAQMAFMDGMRELRRRRGECAAGFRAHLEQAWQAMLARAPISVERALLPARHGDLSLVSEEDLEARLAALNFANVVQRDNKQVLQRLEWRLGRLAGIELDSEYDPVGPDHVAAAVREAFAGCDLTLDVRLVVLKLCERELAPELGRMYAQLDQLLASVEPAGVPRPAMRGAGPAAMSGAQSGAQAPAAGGDAPAWAARFLDRMSSLRGQMQSAAQPHGAHAGAEGAYGADGLDPNGEYMLLSALHNLMQESRGAQAPASPPQSVGQHLSQQEMLSVLSLLQCTPSAALRAALGDTNESLAHRLKQEVLSSATRLGADPSTTRLSPTDEDAIDLVGMLFDVMLDECDLQGRSRELIGRLAVPFVKVAMLDRHMFVQKEHPARRLLNVLAEACEGNHGETPAERTLMTKVEEIIDRLVAEFNENLAIFQTLEEEFREFLAQHKRRIEIAERRAAEIQRGQERLEAARTRMESELSARIGDRELPQAIDGFLRQPWAHHVTMTLLRDDEDGAREGFGLLDGMLVELDEAQRQVVGKPWLQAWRPALQKVFASVGMNADAAAAAIDALHDTLQAVAQSRPDLERPLPELPPVTLPKTADNDASPVRLVGGTDTLDEFDPTDADHFRSLPIGTWLDFIDKDNKVQAGKLSWVSPISSRLLFVNRRGVRFCVASPEELAVMVRLGRLRKHEEGDAFDNAMMGVIDKLGGAAAEA
ncbi:MAG: DUF1631 domain-containing protein [Pseudoxanthomonas sp.]